ncbi:unnamed protein product [Discosporangium mesarthrocarpum]
MSMGDVVCQTIEGYGTETEVEWDRQRTFRMGVTGLLVLCPMSYGWNLLAERLYPGTSFRSLAGKLGVQMVCMPPMVAGQFASLTLLDMGKGLADVRVKLEGELVPTLKVSTCFWPLVGIVSFRFIPVINRPAMNGFAGFFWNIYLSHQANHGSLTLGEEVVKGREEVLLPETREAPEEKGVFKAPVPLVGLKVEDVGVEEAEKAGREISVAQRAAGGKGPAATTGDPEEPRLTTAERQGTRKLVRKTTAVCM